MLGLIPEGFGESYINQHTAMVRSMPEMKGHYLAEMFRSPFAQEQFNEPQRGIKNSFRLTEFACLWSGGDGEPVRLTTTEVSLFLEGSRLVGKILLSPPEMIPDGRNVATRQAVHGSTPCARTEVTGRWLGTAVDSPCLDDSSRGDSRRRTP